MKQLKSKRSALRCLYWAGSLQLLSDAPMQIYPQRRGEATLCPNTSPMQAEGRERDTRRPNAMWQRTTQSDTTGHDRESASQHRETSCAAAQKATRTATWHGAMHQKKKKMFQRQYDTTQHNRFFFSFFFLLTSTHRPNWNRLINSGPTRPITSHQTSGAANLFSDRMYERVSQNLSVLPAFNPR